MARNGLTQWGWREMEELLQCPVCLDVPAVGVVEQCRHGHHICASCKRNVETCPLCKCDFHGTRNFILEELLRHFDILKNTMLLNNIVTADNKSVKRRRSRHKNRNDRPTEILRNTPGKRLVNTPSCTIGKYPCRVVDCDREYPLSRLLNHVRSHHPDMLTESIVDFTAVYTQTFDVPFKNKKLVNRNTFIIFVSGIGLVYLNIEILKSGQLIMYLQMASKYRKCQEYLASVDLFSLGTTYSYNIKLVSTRIGFDTMLSQRLCFTLSKPQLKKICENRRFSCKLALTRFDNLSSNILTRPNSEQIMITAGIRASFLSEVSQKKAVKQPENCKNNKLVNKPPVPPSDFNSTDIQVVVARVLESLNLEDATNYLSNHPTTSNATGNHWTSERQRKKKKTRRPNGN